MRISDWSSDVCSSDLPQAAAALPEPSFDIIRIEPDGQSIIAGRAAPGSEWILLNNGSPIAALRADANGEWVVLPDSALVPGANDFSLVPKTERGRVVLPAPARSEEHTSELQSLMRISYAVFCLKKKTKKNK